MGKFLYKGIAKRLRLFGVAICAKLFNRSVGGNNFEVLSVKLWVFCIGNGLLMELKW